MFAVAWTNAREDIVAAFRHFIGARQQGRPFFLVGHGQGAMHVILLARDFIEDSAELLHDFVCAYTPGGHTPAYLFSGGQGGVFTNVKRCTGPVVSRHSSNQPRRCGVDVTTCLGLQDLQCIINWDSRLANYDAASETISFDLVWWVILGLVGPKPMPGEERNARDQVPFEYPQNLRTSYP